MAFEFKLPDIGEGVVEGEIVRWLVKAGDQVEEDQPMVEVMTDKATVEIPCPVEGLVLECRGAEGELVPVGATMVVIEETDAEKSPPPEPAAAKPVAQVSRPEEGPAPEAKSRAEAVLATPAVRRLAREKGIDLSKIRGTGPGGRITDADIRRGQEAGVTGSVSEAGAEGSIEVIPYQGLRRKIGDRLSLSKRSAVHYSYVEEADVTSLVMLRTKFQSGGESRSLTYLPFILKAVVSGLKNFPLLNSTLDEERGQIELRKYYNIGIATATPKGLIVPVVRDVDQKGLLELAEEVRRITESARQGRVKVNDLQGSTFTVTSLGALGGIAATPVINYPEVAILGVHKIIQRPVVREGQIVVRDMMNLSISLDHRIVDGAVAAQFVHHVIRLLESPGLLMLEHS